MRTIGRGFRKTREKARQILVRLGLQNTNNWAHVIENLGDLHRAMGKLEEAEKELLESLHIA